MLWERLAELDGARLATLRRWSRSQSTGWALLTAAIVTGFYLRLPLVVSVGAITIPVLLIVVASVSYLRVRPAARQLVWPSAPLGARAPRSAA